MLMNNIKSITKKFEHIKGFKFETMLPGSHNFHAIASWVIPETSAKAQPSP